MSRRDGIGAELIPLAMVIASVAGSLALVVAVHRRSAPKGVPPRAIAAPAAPAKRPAPPTPVAVAPPPPMAAPVPAPPPPIPAPVDPTPAVVARIAAEAKSEADRAAEIDRRAESLEADEVRAGAEATRAEAKEAAMRRRIGDLEAKAKEAEEGLADLDRDRDALASLKSKAEDELNRARFSTGMAVLPYKGPSGTWRRPLAIECAHATATVQPGGPTFSLFDMSKYAGQGPTSPIVRAVARVLYRSGRDAAPDGGQVVPYILFVVRPDGIRAYYEARARLESLGLAFGYELVDQATEIDYPDLDDPAQWRGGPGSPGSPAAPGRAAPPVDRADVAFDAGGLTPPARPSTGESGPSGGARRRSPYARSSMVRGQADPRDPGGPSTADEPAFGEFARRPGGDLAPEPPPRDGRIELTPDGPIGDISGTFLADRAAGASPPRAGGALGGMPPMPSVSTPSVGRTPAPSPRPPGPGGADSTARADAPRSSPSARPRPVVADPIGGPTGGGGRLAASGPGIGGAVGDGPDATTPEGPRRPTGGIGNAPDAGRLGESPGVGSPAAPGPFERFGAGAAFAAEPASRPGGDDGDGQPATPGGGPVAPGAGRSPGRTAARPGADAGSDRRVGAGATPTGTRPDDGSGRGPGGGAEAPSAPAFEAGGLDPSLIDLMPSGGFSARAASGRPVEAGGPTRAEEATAPPGLDGPEMPPVDGVAGIADRATLDVPARGPSTTDPSGPARSGRPGSATGPPPSSSTRQPGAGDAPSAGGIPSEFGPPPAPLRLEPRVTIEPRAIGYEIVVACGPKGVTVRPGGYRFSPSRLDEADSPLVTTLRSLEQSRRRERPGDDVRPSIRFLVEPGGSASYRRAKDAVWMGGVAWPTSLQVVDSDPIHVFSREGR